MLVVVKWLKQFGFRGGSNLYEAAGQNHPDNRNAQVGNPRCSWGLRLSITI